MEAAFFDLDKTVIARASLMAFARDFYRAGLLGRRSLLKGAWTQVLYLRWGAGPERLAKIRSSVLSVTAGWERRQVRRIVSEVLPAVIDPIVHAEAVEAIEAHRAAGRRVVMVSAAPEEIVEPLADYLGFDEAIGSVAEIDGAGRYTGAMHRYAYGETKAELIRELAARDGIDLAGSWAYSDSATDLPMLEEVGHPVAVNPDRALRRVAEERGWPVERFERLSARTPAPARPAGERPGLRERIPAFGWVVVGAPTLAAVTTGGAWWWRRRGR